MPGLQPANRNISTTVLEFRYNPLPGEFGPEPESMAVPPAGPEKLAYL